MSPTFISLGLAFSLIFGTMYQTAYMSLPCEYIKGILYSLYPKTFWDSKSKNFLLTVFIPGPQEIDLIGD
jgi:hypothetical protein